MSKETILDRFTMIASQTDEKGIILYANDDFCKIAGYTKEQLIGKNHNIVRHSDMPTWAFKSLWDTVLQGQTWNGIVKNLRKDGGFYWVNATVFPLIEKGKRTFISVRRKPTTDEVLNAMRLYGLGEVKR